MGTVSTRVLPTPISTMLHGVRHFSSSFHRLRNLVISDTENMSVTSMVVSASVSRDASTAYLYTATRCLTGGSVYWTLTKCVCMTSRREWSVSSTRMKAPSPTLLLILPRVLSQKSPPLSRTSVSILSAHAGESSVRNQSGASWLAMVPRGPGGNMCDTSAWTISWRSTKPRKSFPSSRR